MSPFAKELQVAILAAQKAAILTRRVFQETAKGTINKNDKSPVTIGDYGAQALIIGSIKHNFPLDGFVAEEESSALRGPASSLCKQVWELVRTTRLDDDEEELIVGGSIQSCDAMLDLIDLGSGHGGYEGRFWTIDPIDGTKGFLRGGQYAVCIALVEDGQVKVGVLACPNLPTDDLIQLNADIGSVLPGSTVSGVVFSAAVGQGALSRPLTSGKIAEGRPISMRTVDHLSDATFCESFEAAHSNHGLQVLIAQRLGIANPSVRMDSQAKYGSIARGAGDIYLRLPPNPEYRPLIWDHAAGGLIVREAGGMVTDIHGKLLDFGTGRALAQTSGIVAAPSGCHARVLQAIQEVLAASSQASET